MTSTVEPTREFHIRGEVRRKYGVEETLFSMSGNVILADFRAARELAHRMNQVRDAANHPERAVSAGRLNAMGLVDELTHLIVARYRERTNPRVLADALEHLEGRLGKSAVDELLLAFTEEFPPAAVHRGQMTAEEYLSGTTDSTSHREVTLEELMVLWLANRNPAFEPFRELFDDGALRARTAYLECMGELRRFLSGQPKVEGTRSGLLDLLGG